MCIDPIKTPLLYSIGTEMAYKINKHYYNNVHYVWCAPFFNSFDQPPTSNPLTICKRYLEQIIHVDRHAIDVQNNANKILYGAEIKYKDRIITKKQYNEIHQLIASATYDAFLPVLYIIYSDKVIEKCKEANPEEKANNTSKEYKIIDLKDGEFDIIFIKDIISSFVKLDKAGEYKIWEE